MSNRVTVDEQMLVSAVRYALRCPDCGWHPKTQGHHPHCQGDT